MIRGSKNDRDARADEKGHILWDWAGEARTGKMVESDLTVSEREKEG